MPTSIKDAFAAHGLKGTYEGNTALILPIDQAMRDEIGDDNLSRVGEPVSAGQVMVSWVDDGRRRGKVLNTGARNDLTIAVERTDGDPDQIPASDMSSAAISLIRMRIEAGHEATRAARENEVRIAEIERLEAAGEPVDPGMREEIQPTYTAGAFDRIDRFVSSVEAGIGQAIADPFIDVQARSAAFAARHEMGRAEAKTLSREDFDKISEARALRAKIAELNPDHGEAQARLPRAAGDRDVVRNAMGAAGMNNMHAVSPRMAEGIRAIPELSRDLFSAITTTPLESIMARPLSEVDRQTALQSLVRHAAPEWSDAVADRARRILQDRMPGYQFEAQIFSQGGADIMFVRDHAGAYAYAWDSETRVPEIDIDGRILSTYGPDDVPTEEALAELRTTLEGMRYDNGMDIEFGEAEDILDDDPEEDGPDFNA